MLSKPNISKPTLLEAMGNHVLRPIYTILD